MRRVVLALLALTFATAASAQPYRPGFGFARSGFKFLSAPATGGPALAIDAIGGALGAGSAGTASWSHTIASGANLLVVGLGVNVQADSNNVDAPSATTVTAGGVAMTRLDRVMSTGTPGRDRMAEIWYLANPPTGAVTITATAPQGTAASAFTLGGYSLSLLNAITSSPFGTLAKTAVTAAAGASTLSATTTEPSAGIVFAAGSARSTSALTLGAGQTAIGGGVVSNLAVSVSRIPAGSNVTASISWTTADQGALIAVPIKSN